jgi:hypothetical protein
MDTRARGSNVVNLKLGLICFVALSFNALHLYGQIDTSSHTVQFVTVDQGVKLEVLDWGGTGKPLVFLAGVGNTAHGFDSFSEIHGEISCLRHHAERLRYLQQTGSGWCFQN